MCLGNFSDLKYGLRTESLYLRPRDECMQMEKPYAEDGQFSIQDLINMGVMEKV